jgi:hypothetical protein
MDTEVRMLDSVHCDAFESSELTKKRHGHGLQVIDQCCTHRCIRTCDPSLWTCLL